MQIAIPVILVVILLLAAVLIYLYRRPLPQMNGTLKVKGLRAPVEIIRDKWGVPHIYAQNADDLFFAQGYVHAQDRLWKMELNRRIAHGRLSEIFGAIAFRTDHMLRAIGLLRSARNDLGQIDAETLRHLEAYAHGANVFIETHVKRLPLEFTLLGCKPEPWKPLDSLAWAKMMAWNLSSNWAEEILNAALIGRVGPERAAKLRGDYPSGNPIILPDQTFTGIIEQTLAQFRDAKQWLPPGLGASGGMSNSWVVDGTKTVTGKPLLASDPHLGLQMPSIWYENHLVSPEVQVTGVSFPGEPGVIIGHNADIAWGFTNSFFDVQDLYIEKFSADEMELYEYQGEWEKATILHEEILVKGEKEPRIVEIIVTRHGPVINSLSSITEKQKTALALRWTAHDESHLQRAIMKINRARNWGEFCEAVRDWSVPSQNMVYADRAGNIGYYTPGMMPTRSKPAALTPVPGWTSDYDWMGYVPHEELPHALNPSHHYVVTANNQLVGKEYPHYLAAETMNGYRARRIVDMLIAKEKLSADDFARIQVDLYSAPAGPFCELLIALSAEILAEPALRAVKDKAAQALDAVKGWDRVLSANSVAGTVYELTQYFAMRRVFEPWLGDLTDHFIGVGYRPLVNDTIVTYLDRSMLVLQGILDNDEREWFQSTDKKPLTRVQILALALNDALAYLQKAVAKDVSKWQWGIVHPAGFPHPLGAVKPLDKLFNRGPFAYGGDPHTVWQASWVPKFPIQFEGGFTASWRQIIDLGDWDASRGILTTGQSGHPASKHYDDMISMWLNGEYHPLLWSREKVDAHAEAKLVLEP